MGSTPQRSPVPPSGPATWWSLCSAINRITISRAGRARPRRKSPLLSRSHWPDAARQSPYAAPCSPRPSARSPPDALAGINLRAADPGPQRLRCADPQHARDRGDRRPLRRVLRTHLSDHAHRTLTKLVGILTRTSHNSDPPKIGSLRKRRDGSVLTVRAPSDGTGSNVEPHKLVATEA